MEEELRKQAVQRHLAGELPKAVYTSLDRSKKWFFKWLNRYQSGAEDWYQERSRAPLTTPSELSTADRELITATRKRLDSSPYAQIGVHHAHIFSLILAEGHTAFYTQKPSTQSL